MSRRQQRLNDLLRQSLAEIIARELKDPRLELTLISITEVDVSPDLRGARVHVSVMSPDDQAQDAITALNHSRGYIRRLLAPRLTLRHIPNLRFELDTRIAEDQHVSELINAIATDTVTDSVTDAATATDDTTDPGPIDPYASCMPSPHDIPIGPDGQPAPTDTNGKTEDIAAPTTNQDPP
jgi:ribosome-binding factor A